MSAFRCWMHLMITTKFREIISGIVFNSFYLIIRFPRNIFCLLIHFIFPMHY